jgi:hypothetical protein
MLESAVEMLGSLILSALTLLIAACIVGSIIAALRAVSRGDASESVELGGLRFRRRAPLLRQRL